MEANERGALMLVRFVAAALIGWATVEVVLYIVICRHQAVPVEIFSCVIKSLPFIAGVIILAKARAISEWLADKLDL